MEALSPWFWLKILFLVKSLLITLDQGLADFISLTSKLKQVTSIFKESKMLDAFLKGLNVQLIKSNCRFPIFQTIHFLLSSLSFIVWHPCIFLPCSNSLQSQIHCCINILHLLSFLFPTSTHPSLLFKVGISYSPVFPFYKNRADLCLKDINGCVPQNMTQQRWSQTLCGQPEITRIWEDTDADITGITKFAHFHLAISLKGHSPWKREADGRLCRASDGSQFWHYTADRA